MTINALDIIATRDSELEGQAQFRTLWQETADLIFPRQNQIISLTNPGEDKSCKIYDPTAIMDSQEMASGLSSAIIPTGQEFFGLKAGDRQLANDMEVQNYLSKSTESLHDELFESNWLLQWNEALRGLAVFGTCNLYSEWDAQSQGLNFKDFPIGSYVILEDSYGNVNAAYITFTFTARQAWERFGDAASDDVKKAVAEPKSANKPFEFIHAIVPRQVRNPRLVDNLNMPWASVFVDVKAKQTMEESGFQEFPCHVARWMKSSSEKYGRGQGTEILSAVKTLQVMMRDFIECGNKWNNPPLEVLQDLEGIGIRTVPGSINYVQQIPSIKALQQQALGNFPITEKMLDRQQEIIHKAFYRDIFGQLSSLTGDRRTTVEIIERIREGLRRLALPVSRIERELLTPQISRCLKLCIRNGRIDPPPPALAGQRFGIEYLGELGLALRNQQAKGFIQFVSTTGELAKVWPDAMDIPNMDRGLRRFAETSGVNIDDLSTEEEVAAKRQARQQQQAAAQMLAGAGEAAKAYGSATKAPEEGSPAEALMGAEK